MKYLTLAADYTVLDLKDQYTGKDIMSFLPAGLSFKIQQWNKKYKKIIPLSTEERRQYENEINDLDMEGIAICEDIKKNLSEKIKIRYFSEGKLKYLT